MRKLVLLLSALLILSASATSPASAARHPLDIRLQAFLAAVYQSLFPLSGVYVVPGGTVPGDDPIVVGGGGGSGFVGGDADDYGHGRGGTNIGTGPRIVRSSPLPQPEPDTGNKGITIPHKTR